MIWLKKTFDFRKRKTFLQSLFFLVIITLGAIVLFPIYFLIGSVYWEIGEEYLKWAYKTFSLLYCGFMTSEIIIKRPHKTEMVTMAATMVLNYMFGFAVGGLLLTYLTNARLTEEEKHGRKT